MTLLHFSSLKSLSRRRRIGVLQSLFGVVLVVSEGVIFHIYIFVILYFFVVVDKLFLHSLL